MKVHGLLILAVGLLIAADEKKADKPAKDDAKPFLGIQVATDATAGGTVIQQVTADSPAAKAGLKTGDVITKVGDKAIKGPKDVVAAVKGSKAGMEITLHIKRGGKDMDVKVKLGSQPAK